MFMKGGDKDQKRESKQRWWKKCGKVKRGQGAVVDKELGTYLSSATLVLPGFVYLQSVCCLYYLHGFNKAYFKEVVF